MPDRIILIDKPLRWTSFDVVKKLRKPLLEEKRSENTDPNTVIKKIKVGHAGTLDPLASGLLVLCSGKLTTKISGIQDAEKEYTGTITIGATTPSYDLETAPENFQDYNHINFEQIIRLTKEFTGRMMQLPPIHSAKKIDGQRAYDKARKGHEFELEPREIIIHDFEILKMNLPDIEFRIRCSKGTYIRSIAYDFGKSLGTGGYLSALRRTRIGQYDVDDALTPEEFLTQLAVKQDIK